MKKWNTPLSLIALINIMGYLGILGSGGHEIEKFFKLLLYFIIATIIIIILCIIYRNKWFQKNILFSSMVCLIFCTPIPLISYYYIESYFSEEQSIISQSGGECGPACIYYTTEYKNGEVFKKEIIYENQSSNVVVEERYWHKFEMHEEFRKDSTWIYFNKEDTVKIEYFEDGVLVNTRTF